LGGCFFFSFWEGFSRKRGGEKGKRKNPFLFRKKKKMDTHKEGKGKPSREKRKGNSWVLLKRTKEKRRGEGSLPGLFLPLLFHWKADRPV